LGIDWIGTLGKDMPSARAAIKNKDVMAARLFLTLVKHDLEALDEEYQTLNKAFIALEVESPHK
jgi:hypothetical protein